MFVFITGCFTLFHFLPASKSNSSLSLPLSFLYAALYHVLPLLSWQIRKKKLLLRKPWAFKRNFRNCLYLLLMWTFFFFLLSTEESACYHSEAQLLHSPIFLTIFIDVVLCHFPSVSYWSAERKKYFISSPHKSPWTPAETPFFSSH